MVLDDDDVDNNDNEGVMRVDAVLGKFEESQWAWDNEGEDGTATDDVDKDET